jgi:hypothetical protein
MDGWEGWKEEDTHRKFIGRMDKGMRLLERKIPLHIYFVRLIRGCFREATQVAKAFRETYKEMDRFFQTLCSLKVLFAWWFECLIVKSLVARDPHLFTLNLERGNFLGSSRLWRLGTITWLSAWWQRTEAFIMAAYAKTFNRADLVNVDWFIDIKYRQSYRRTLRVTLSLHLGMFVRMFEVMGKAIFCYSTGWYREYTSRLHARIIDMSKFLAR